MNMQMTFIALIPRFPTSTGRVFLPRQLPQLIRQNAAIPVILHFLRRVHPHHHRELLLGAVVRHGPHLGLPPPATPTVTFSPPPPPAPARPSASRPPPFSDAFTPSMWNVSLPVSPSEAAVSPAWNCSGSTPMPTRLLRWMRSKLSAITARTPSNATPFAAQSRDEPEPYSLPARIISGTPSFWYSTEAS